METIKLEVEIKVSDLQALIDKFQEEVFKHEREVRIVTPETIVGFFKEAIEKDIDNMSWEKIGPIEDSNKLFSMIYNEMYSLPVDEDKSAELRNKDYFEIEEDTRDYSTYIGDSPSM